MMKKIFSLLFFLFLATCFTSAQPLAIEESEAFDEPEEGKLKLIQLENRNTVLLYFLKEKGFTVRVFDPARKLIADQQFHPITDSKGKPSKTADIRTVMGVKGDVVCFVGDLVDKIPTLYRVVIDGNKGTLKKKEKIGELDEFKRSYGYAIAFGGVPAPDFYVSKDPESSNYAVALFNSFASDRNKRIEIVHYGENHNVISRAFYNSPNEEFKYLELVDLLVFGSEKVIACATAHNEGDDKSILLATLEKGAMNIGIKRMEFAKNMRLTKGLLRYNKQNNLLALVAVKQIGRDEFAGIFALFNPADYSTVFYKDISLPDIDKKYKAIFGDKEAFEGVPQYFNVNEDGTYTLVFEEMTQVRSSNYQYTVLGNTVVAVLDDKTNEIESYLIPKSHRLVGSYGPMYASDRQSSAQALFNADQYKSFEYVDSKNGKFIFFNDVMENLSSIEKGKLTTILGISESDAFICAIKGKNLKRDPLFGQPTGKEHNFAMFTVSDYHKDSGTFATVKLENDKGKRMRVIWMKL